MYRQIMKNQPIPDITVWKDVHAFRVYQITLVDRIGEEKHIYQNYKPTIKELREFREKYYRGY